MLTGSPPPWARRHGDDAAAPGDSLVRLLGARVVTDEGEVLGAVDVRQRFGIELRFRVLTHGEPVRPKFKLVRRLKGRKMKAKKKAAHKRGLGRNKKRRQNRGKKK